MVNSTFKETQNHKASCGNVVVFSTAFGRGNVNLQGWPSLPESHGPWPIGSSNSLGIHTSLVGYKKKILSSLDNVFINMEGQPLKSKAKLRTKKKGRFGFPDQQKKLTHDWWSKHGSSNSGPKKNAIPIKVGSIYFSTWWFHSPIWKK